MTPDRVNNVDDLTGGGFDDSSLSRWDDDGGAISPDAAGTVAKVIGAEESGSGLNQTAATVCNAPGTFVLASVIPASTIDESQAVSATAGSGLNPITPAPRKGVYPALARHQRAESVWENHRLLVVCREWYHRLADEFALQVPPGDQVPIRLAPAIRRNCGGWFRPGHNEFGLECEIAIAVSAELVADVGEFLGTLLHEVLHLEEFLTGTPGKDNYHTARFRKRAAEFGLVIDPAGYQSYAPDGRFLDLLRRHEVRLPNVILTATALASGPPPADRPAGGRRKPGRSKLRKWTCGCTAPAVNVRVGRAEFHAVCTRPGGCGQPFRPC